MTNGRRVTLTPGQYRVVQALMFDGADNPTIALRLDMGLSAVSMTLSRVFDRTGYYGRTALALAIARGWLIIEEHK